MGLYDRDYSRDQDRPPAWGATPLTTLTVAGLVGLFLGDALADRRLLVATALRAEDVRAGEWWRVLSYPLTHVGVGGLFGNLLGLWFFGGAAERRVGPARLGLTLLAATLAAGGVTLALGWAGGRETFLVGVLPWVLAVTVLAALVAGEEPVQLVLVPVPMSLREAAGLFGFIAVAVLVTQERSTAVKVGTLAATLTGWAAAVLPALPSLGRRTLTPRRREEWDGPATLPFRPPSAPPPVDADSRLDAEVDRILEKISRDGMGALTAGERRTLERASERSKKSKKRR